MTMTLTERNAILSGYASGIYRPESLGTPLLVSAPSTSGFYAAAYRDDFIGKIVVVFRGVDGPNDAGSILALATGGWHPQFDQAVSFIADVARRQYGDDWQTTSLAVMQSEFLVTGHSQGGSQSQVSGRLFGLDGAAFDPAGAYRQTLLPEFAAAASRVASTRLPTKYLRISATIQLTTAPYLSAPGSILANRECCRPSRPRAFQT